jgi:hypothetical protein
VTLEGGLERQGGDEDSDENRYLLASSNPRANPGRLKPLI